MNKEEFFQLVEKELSLTTNIDKIYRLSIYNIKTKTKMIESDIPCIECGCTIYWDNGECENCGMDN